MEIREALLQQCASLALVRSASDEIARLDQRVDALEMENSKQRQALSTGAPLSEAHLKMQHLRDEISLLKNEISLLNRATLDGAEIRLILARLQSPTDDGTYMQALRRKLEEMLP